MKIWLFIVFAIVFSITMLWMDAHATSTCTVSGQVLDGAGNPVVNATVYFNSMNTQVVNGQTVFPITKASTTDASGNLSTIALIQGIFVQITICQAQGGGCGVPVTGFVPITSSVTFANLLSGTATFTGSTLTGNLNASGFRIFNLGANTTANDALSQGQSSLNNLAAPTGNYAMGSNKLTGLAIGTGSGDTMAYGLNHLNDLAAATGNYAMGSSRITGLAAATTTGDALSEGNPIGAITPAAGTFTAATITTATIPITLAVGGQQLGKIQLFNESSGGTITPALSNGPNVQITLVDNGGWTLANPNISPLFTVDAAHWSILVKNSSGTTGGTITLDTDYRTDSSWSSTGPANGKTRVCPVYTIPGGTSYIGPCTGDETN